MHLKDFRDEYSGAPLTLDEFAEAAAQVENAPELREAAKGYLDAIERFERQLHVYNVEIG